MRDFNIIYRLINPIFIQQSYHVSSYIWLIHPIIQKILSLKGLLVSCAQNNFSLIVLEFQGLEFREKRSIKLTIRIIVFRDHHHPVRFERVRR